MRPSCPLGISCIGLARNRLCTDGPSPQKKKKKKSGTGFFRGGGVSTRATQEKVLYWPSLFGQDGCVLASFLFCIFIDLEFVSSMKTQKITLAISTHLDRTSLANRDLANRYGGRKSKKMTQYACLEMTFRHKIAPNTTSPLREYNRRLFSYFFFVLQSLVLKPIIDCFSLKQESI